MIIKKTLIAATLVLIQQAYTMDPNIARARQEQKSVRRQPTEQEIAKQIQMVENAGYLVPLSQGFPDITQSVCQYLSLKDIVHLKMTCKALKDIWDHERTIMFDANTLPSQTSAQTLLQRLIASLGSASTSMIGIGGMYVAPTGYITSHQKLSASLKILADILQLHEYRNPIELSVDFGWLGLLPETISGLKQLKTLSLSMNRLGLEGMKRVCTLTNLQKLYFASNDLRILPEEICKLVKLDTLDLSGNRISQASMANICQLTNLQRLCLNATGLKELPQKIGNLTKLRRLELQLNVMSPETIARLCMALPNLEKIFIDFNNLKVLPESIRNLKKLTVLNLEGNDLELAEIIKICAWLPTIQELYLGYNELETLPLQITNLKNLKKLGLTHNNFAQETQAIVRSWLPHTEIKFW